MKNNSDLGAEIARLRNELNMSAKRIYEARSKSGGSASRFLKQEYERLCAAGVTPSPTPGHASIVAWMNAERPYLVCSDEVKQIWLGAKPEHVEHYTIPLGKLTDAQALIAALDRLIFVAEKLGADQDDGGALHQARAALAAQTEQPEICTGCNGRGEVGGLTVEGYQSEPCPYCKQAGAAHDDLVAALNEVVGCFEAAYIEGLADVLAETSDERLKDLVERRLKFAHTAAVGALAAQSGINPKS